MLIFRKKNFINSNKSLTMHLNRRTIFFLEEKIYTYIFISFVNQSREKVVFFPSFTLDSAETRGLAS